MKTNSSSDPVAIGRVGSPAGLRGEFRVTLYAQDSDNLKEGKVLLLKHAQRSEISAKIEHVRYQKDRPVIKLEGVDDRTAAESLRDMEISMEASDLEELPEGEHYVRDIIGSRVVDIAGGDRREIGVLSDVIQNTAQSVLDVKTPEGRSVLIPAVDAFMRRIDEDEGLIEVELIPGFTEQ